MRISQININPIVARKPDSTQKPPLLTPASWRARREAGLSDFSRETREAVRKMLVRKSDFHRGLGRSFEKLNNPRAAIRAYEHAKHYTPADITLVKDTLKARTNFFRELWA